MLLANIIPLHTGLAQIVLKLVLVRVRLLEVDAAPGTGLVRGFEPLFPATVAAPESRRRFELRVLLAFAGRDLTLGHVLAPSAATPPRR